MYGWEARYSVSVHASGNVTNKSDHSTKWSIPAR
jgi:hypothetical protein